MSAAEWLKAGDGRVLAMVLRHDFDDFASHPPTFETEAEREWLRDYYRVASPELERVTKAHVTADELPLQITLLNRPAGAFVKPHYHINERPPETPTRHQVMVCLSGKARIGVFDKDGPKAGDVDLETGDVVLLYEGHSIETLVDGTRLLEVKQGPAPANPFDDNIAIEQSEVRTA